MNEKPRMWRDRRRVGLKRARAGVWVCCVAPWAVALLGVAGAVMLARLAFIQPYVVAATMSC